MYIGAYVQTTESHLPNADVCHAPILTGEYGIAERIYLYQGLFMYERRETRNVFSHCVPTHPPVYRHWE